MAIVNPGDLIIDEMSIVDVLTKLIFDAESKLDEIEHLVVELLGQIEPSLVNAHRRDVSEYLRSMGVDEMIKAVGQIKTHMVRQSELIAAGKAGQRQSLYR